MNPCPPLSLDILKDKAEELVHLPQADPELPTVLALAVSIGMWLLIMGGGVPLGGSAVAVKDNVMACVSIVFVCWVIASALMGRRLDAATGKRQALFGVWASKQNWSPEEWERIARSPELPVSFTRLAVRWREAMGQHDTAAPLASGSSLPLLLRHPPRLTWVLRRTGIRVAWFGFFLVVAAGGIAAAVFEVSHRVGATAAVGLLTGWAFLLLVGPLQASLWEQRALRTAVAGFDLTPAAWTQIQASPQISGKWRTAIHRHLNATQDGWSLLPHPAPPAAAA